MSVNACPSDLPAGVKIWVMPLDTFAAIDQQNADPIDAITVSTFGCGHARSVFVCLDPELMHFHVPRHRVFSARRNCIEDSCAGAQNTPRKPIGRRSVRNRREPTLDPAVERVVIAALVMWLGGLARDGAPSGNERGKAPTAIAATIGHVDVEPKVIPA